MEEEYTIMFTHSSYRVPFHETLLLRHQDCGRQAKFSLLLTLQFLEITLSTGCELYHPVVCTNH